MPTLIKISIESMALTGLQQVAGTLAENPAALARLSGLAGSFETKFDLANTYRGEAYAGLATIRNPDLSGSFDRDDPARNDPSKLIRNGVPKGLSARRLMTRYLQYWTAVETAIKKAPNDLVEQRKAAVKITEGLEAKKSVIDTLISVLGHEYDNVGTHFQAAQANQIVTRALLAALNVRAKTGSLPTRIEEIPGVWTDPFTGKPLRISTVNHSFRIYSVGPDLKDDGGLTGRNTVAVYPPFSPKWQPPRQSSPEPRNATPNK